MYKHVIAMSQEDLRGPMDEFNDVEIEEGMRLQNPQLKLLRTLGVAQMIEQKAGTEIPPLAFEDDPNQPPTVDVKRTDKMVSLTIDDDGYFNDGWRLNPFPQRMADGSFDTTLRIKAIRVTNQQREGFEMTHGIQSVLIEFTQDKYLKVVGDKTTFEGDLAAVNEELLTRVQVGIKEAFTNPTTSDAKMLFA